MYETFLDSAKTQRSTFFARAPQNPIFNATRPDIPPAKKALKQTGKTSMPTNSLLSDLRSWENVKWKGGHFFIVLGAKG